MTNEEALIYAQNLPIFHESMHYCGDCHTHCTQTVSAMVLVARLTATLNAIAGHSEPGAYFALKHVQTLALDTVNAMHNPVLIAAARIGNQR